MNRKLKKIASFFLVLIMAMATNTMTGYATITDNSCSLISKQLDGTYKTSTSNDITRLKVKALNNCIFKSDDGALFSKANESTFIPVNEINIPLTGASSTKSIMDKNNIKDETAKYIFDIISNAKKNKVTVESIKVYVPIATNSTTQKNLASINSVASSSSTYRTYSGYGNKTYYEELVAVQTNSLQDRVGVDTWGDYKNSVISGVMTYIRDAAFNYVSMGTWSIASIFLDAIPSSVPNYAGVAHEARLKEVKFARHTYVVENGQYYFGSITENAFSYFQNYLVSDSFWSDAIRGNDTPMQNRYTPNFYSPDQLAYYSYLNGGSVEKWYRYYYGGKYFDSAYA